MELSHITALRHSISAASRRSVLGAITGGLLAAGPLARLADESEAKKKGKRKNKKRKNKKKDKKQQPSGPVARADATCSATGTRGLFNPNRRVAQTFTATAGGPLVRAELLIDKDAGSSGDYVLHLGAVDDFGVPTNEVLAVASVANRDVPENVETTVTFTFATPFAVKANAQYALVLTRTGSDRFAWLGSRGDLCAGQAFLSADRTAPFESDTLGDGSDFNFTTFVTS